MAKNIKLLSDEAAFSHFDEQMDKILGKVEKSGYENLSKPERMIYLIMGFEGGIRNSGLGGYLENPQGVYVEDLIGFLREIKVGAIAGDIEQFVHHIQSFFPAFPHKNFFGEALRTLPKDEQEDCRRLESETTKRLREYRSALPFLAQLLASAKVKS